MASLSITKEDLQKALEARHGKDEQEKLSSACVGIAGLGGLGSHVATLLARVGVGKLILADFDVVDITNIHRQNYELADIGKKKTDALHEKLLKINPFLDYIKMDEKLDENLILTTFQECQIICEAFDDAYAKAMITETVLMQMQDKILVGASGMAGIGNPNAIKATKKMKNFYLCGDEKSDVQKEKTLFAPRVSICASMQASLITQIILDKIDI